ncbi:MAG: LTA synthase family protein [Lachnospiraceae bacterium]|nr:LTA synthase family protein [Lachnospiraceae bacterium]
MDNEQAERRIDFPSWIINFGAFFLSLIYWEIAIHCLTNADAAFTPLSLVLLPAMSLFLTALCSTPAKTHNKIFFYVMLSLLSIFYTSQLIYHDIFGSYYSVSMMGMGGDAITNFKASVFAELGENAHLIIVLFLPLIVCIFLDVFFAKKLNRKLFARKQHIRNLGVCLLLTLPVWFLGVFALRLAGTGARSAYAIYNNSLSDTDTSVSKLGLISTSFIEARAYCLGLGSDGAKIAVENAASQGEDLTKALAGLSTEDPETTLFPTSIPTPVPTLPVETSPVPNATATPTPTQTPTPTPAPLSYTHWCYDEIDFNELAELATDEETKSLCRYFATVNPTSKNEYTGIFEGYNLIYICAESFWTYAINEEVTPTLYKMANNGIVLNNYYSSFLNTTINGEFAFATALWPDISRKNVDNGHSTGSFASTATNYMPFGLGNLFYDQLGAKSYGFHNYKGTYYSRNKTWPNIGYITKFRDVGDGNGGMKFSNSWITSDLEMMQQSVDDYINNDTFHAYYMTFSGHGPYNGRDTNKDSFNRNAEKHIDEVRAALGDEITDSQALYYIAAHVEVDKAMEYLLKRLEEAGKLDNTVIVLAADHYPYYIDKNNNTTTRAALAGKKLDAETELFKSTCIIYNAGLKEPIVSDAYCSTVDILPTVLNLLNIKYDSRLMAGKDVFSDAPHKAVLYNKSFVTDYVTYYAPKDKVTWKVDTENYSKQTLDDYLSSMSSLIDAEYASSLQIVNTDFYRFVWENAIWKNNNE